MFALFFVALVVFWLYLYLSHHRSSGDLNYWFSFLFGLVPFFGGFIGILKSRLWGGLKSSMGRAILSISLGLFLWGFGENIWSYYNFFKGVPAPYPSLADLGFAPSVFFYTFGTLLLSRATGAYYALKKYKWAKVFVVILPIILLVPSYYIQVTVARKGALIPQGDTALKAVLDFAYPFGDFLGLTFATIVYILSYKYFGGIYKKSVIALFSGLGVMYIADSVFSYTTTVNTYYNADWGDLLLALGVFLMTFGILAFAVSPAEKKPTTEEASI